MLRLVEIAILTLWLCAVSTLYHFDQWADQHSRHVISGWVE